MSTHNYLYLILYVLLSHNLIQTLLHLPIIINHNRLNPPLLKFSQHTRLIQLTESLEISKKMILWFIFPDSSLCCYLLISLYHSAIRCSTIDTYIHHKSVITKRTESGSVYFFSCIFLYLTLKNKSRHETMPIQDILLCIIIMCIVKTICKSSIHKSHHIPVSDYLFFCQKFSDSSSEIVTLLWHMKILSLTAFSV